MGSGISTREFRPEDYPAALELWRRVGGIEIAEGDSEQDIAAFLLRNPDLSRVAAEGSKIVGVALCGHDGHRGYIYHLAIDPACQGLGVGKRLVNECRSGLRQAGLKRALILVANDNPIGRAFWLRCGWEDVPGADVMGMDL
jgi:ribosomal protein S18 acetylase RimI-like enzyme